MYILYKKIVYIFFAQNLNSQENNLTLFLSADYPPNATLKKNYSYIRKFYRHEKQVRAFVDKRTYI